MAKNQREGDVDENGESLPPAHVTNAGRLERGATRLMVMRDLVSGYDRRTVAVRYGVTPQAITRFTRKWAAEIEKLRAGIAEEFIHVWVADKEYRLMEYQQNVEDLRAALDQVVLSGLTLSAEEVPLLKEIRGTLRQIAEELGQLPPRVAISADASAVTYNFGGDINPDDVV